MAESGTIGAIPALANAVGDALRRYGYAVNRIPIRAEELLNVMSANGSRKTGQP
jgi:CO/xanthine dehydrogenase Mo-binding subunit